MDNPNEKDMKYGYRHIKIKGSNVRKYNGIH